MFPAFACYDFVFYFLILRWFSSLYFVLRILVVLLAQFTSPYVPNVLVTSMYFSQSLQFDVCMPLCILKGEVQLGAFLL